MRFFTASIAVTDGLPQQRAGGSDGCEREVRPPSGGPLRQPLVYLVQNAAKNP